jgi:carboxyl-terminal processing protease
LAMRPQPRSFQRPISRDQQTLATSPLRKEGDKTTSPRCKIGGLVGWGSTNCDFLAKLFLLIVCLACWTTRLPAHLVAQPEDSAQHFTALLQQADQAANQNLWHQAVDYFEKARDLADDTHQPKIDQRLQWCRTHADLDDSYRDGSLIRLTRSLDPHQAHALLTEVLQLVSKKYYQKTELNELLEKSLLQLQAATCNSVVGSKQQLDDAFFATLKKQITLIIDDKTPVHHFTLNQLAPLTESLRKFSLKTGLGPSWAATELAYALVNSLDEYSYILSPLQYDQLTARLEGNYRGVGIDLVFEGSYPTIFDVVDNSPAARAGILPGDTLLRIDGINLEHQSSSRVGNLLAQGDKEPITVTLHRKNQEINFTLQREQLNAPSIRYVHLLDKDQKVGYLRVADFDNDTAYEMRRALSELKSKGAESILIDLRCNGGGVLHSAVDAARLFLDQGLIVTVNSASGTTTYRAQNDGYACSKLPLALLVDEHTASAAEIFTAALKDHQRATIVGRKTRGKALVQTIYQLQNAPTALSLTTASYLPPGNYNFHRKGILPDIEVNPSSLDNQRVSSMAYYLSPDDTILHKSLACLNR